jgi:hypothetical protein
MSDEVRDFHFNVNVRSNGVSKAKMANNEEPFLRAMEIQELKREKKEIERLEAEKLAALNAPEVVEPELTEEPAVQEETVEPVEASPVPVVVAEATAPTPIKAKPSGGGVPGPTPRNDFTDAEKAAMLKRARAHAAEVKARKSK